MRRLLSMILLAFTVKQSLMAQCAPAGNPVVGQVCTYTSNGTFLVPSGYTLTLLVEAWGGGGSGGELTTDAKGGGGGGAYALRNYTNIPAGSYAIQVGGGGIATSSAGQAGGNSIFNFIPSLIAAGGSPGNGTNGGLGGQTSASSGTSISAGLNGSNSSGNNGGAGGSAGSLGGGAGGAGGIANNGHGQPGSSPGGGGGGKAGPGNAGNSGTGGNGLVIVTVLGLSVLLPVELTYFKATPKGDQVLLQWETASEHNNEAFIIERSAVGLSFEPIASIAGQGTTTETSEYNFTDLRPRPGTSYYRLKQVDFNGKYEYSELVSVQRTQTMEIVAYPIPVTDVLNLALPHNAAGTVDISLFSVQGQLLLTKIMEASEHLKLDLPSLQTGQYLLQVQCDGQVYNTLIMKE